MPRNARWILVAGALLAVLGAAIAFRFLRHDGASLSGIDPPQSGIVTSKGSEEAKPLASEAQPTTAAPPSTVGETAEQRAAVESGILRVQVVDPTGAAISGARLALFQGKELLHSAVTDAGGGAQFDSSGGSAQYALFAQGWALARGEIELGAGERTLALNEGETLGGTVLLDGLAPDPPIELRFESYERNASFANLPKPIFEALRDANLLRPSLTASTGAGGSFAFRGFAADAAGTLHWKDACFLEGPGSEYERQSFPVPAPRRDLMLRMISGLELRLRVVDPAGNALPGAPVSVFLKSVTAARETTSLISADSEGRFSFPILPYPDCTLSVEVAQVGGAGARKYPLQLPALPRAVLDAGDLATGPARAVSVLVQDPEQRPIANAAVNIWPPSTQAGMDRTDASGRITRNFAPEDRELAVTATGFRRKRAPLPPDAAEVVVTLTKATRLEIEVVGLSDRKNELAVEVTADSPPLLDPDEGDLVASLDNPTPAGADIVVSRGFHADDDGRWRISGLTPGKGLRAVLHRMGGPELDAIDVAPLAEGEQRAVQMRLKDLGRSFRVRVLGPGRAPLSRAFVFVTDPTNAANARGYGVDARAEVELQSMYGERFRLVARCQGFPPKLVALSSFPRATVDIILDEPHSIEIELVSPDGTLLQTSFTIMVPVENSFERATSTGPGRYRVDRLPAAEVNIQVYVPPTYRSFVHDARVPFARIVIGEPGTALVTLKRVGGKPAAPCAIALAVAGAATDWTRQEFASFEGDEAKAWFEGLASGTYDAWLEQRVEDGLNQWSRVGQPTKVVIDAEHPTVELELRP
ncbi:MAG TPA: carboxypeptidase-like regulatory domain-containing protein [Planctomycetota bacterium]|nr:carboxypeptidase-like regulatory domain-containing protein [Planctomycetota bacterium]